MIYRRLINFFIKKFIVFIDSYDIGGIDCFLNSNTIAVGQLGNYILVKKFLEHFFICL